MAILIVNSLDRKRKSVKKRFGRAIVVLIRNTTWRCGKLERLIVTRLHKETAKLGKPGIPLNDMLKNFDLTGKKKNEFLDAIKRLERRNIVRILNL
ncbi:MAG: hypothetical protein QXU21_04450 [Candidatus Bathyarchaeia archaeon]